MTTIERIDEAFRAFLEDRGLFGGLFNEGYNHEEGNDYAGLLGDFLDEIAPGNPWRISMRWLMNESGLIAERKTGEDGPFVLYERYGLTDVLGGQTREDTDRRFLAFARDVIDQVERSGDGLEFVA